jgi:hypothetical protein
LSRMDSLYGEEPGDYQQVLNAVDSKTMEKIQKGKGTKEDFLSALNSLNTVGESIEDRREKAESAERFDITTDIQRKQQEATERIAGNRLTHAASEGGKDRAARKAEGDASRTHSAAEGDKDRTSADKRQGRQITSTEFMFGEKQKQEWAKHSDHLNLSQDQLDQTWNIHVEDMSEKIREFNDTLAQKDRHHAAVLEETKRMGDLKVDAAEAVAKEKTASSLGFQIWHDKSQTEFDPDAHSAAMMGVGSLSGPTPDQLQSYMDNPEQFQRQLTPSERAIKALQTPNLSEEAQEKIATWANADAGTGGVKFVRHPETGEYVMAVGPRGSMSQLPTSRKSATEMRIEFDILRDKAKGIKDDQKRLDYLNDQKTKQLGDLRARSIDPEEAEYKDVVSNWDELLRKQRVRMGIEEGSDEDIPEYDLQGKLKN